MLRTPYNYDRDEVSKNTALVFNDESLAQQQFKDENNINLMIRKYGCLLYTSPSPRDRQKSRMPSSA